MPPERPLQPNDRPTINELILAYLEHVAGYYKPNHGANKEADCVDDALRVMQESGYGREPVDRFRPSDLKKVRPTMILKNWSRTYFNGQVNRIKRMFRHAVEQDLVPGTVYHALQAVSGLRKGTPGVRESKKVRPVAIAHIKAVLGKTRPMMGAMLRFAYYTGTRPGEVCVLKPCHINRSSKTWIFVVPPNANKTEHHELERKVHIGPQAQRVLAPWLDGIEAHEHVFSPARAEAIRQAERRGAQRHPRELAAERVAVAARR